MGKQSVLENISDVTFTENLYVETVTQLFLSKFHSTFFVSVCLPAAAAAAGTGAEGVVIQDHALVMTTTKPEATTKM